MSFEHPSSIKSKILQAIYDKLLIHYGPQHWWPARTPFEVCVGAILVQNTNWKNVGKAIGNIRREKLLSFRRLYECPVDRLKGIIRPAGYFNIKAKRLRNFLDYLEASCKGSLDRLKDRPWPELRSELLAVNGIGPETADSILLYALGKPVFVIDAYTRRLLVRHGFSDDTGSYEAMQALFMSNKGSHASLFNEYHALIVQLGKDFGKDALLDPDYPLKDRKYFL